jgi:hypothetical protein
MSFGHHLDEFAGRPVRWFDPRAKRKGGKPCVWRVGGMDIIKSQYRDGQYEFPELLDLFLTAHSGKDLTALVIGAWNYDDMCDRLSGRGAVDVVEALVANRGRMANLRALFFGDITSDECEVSWIGHGDLAALLPAFPKLEAFTVRGAANLSLGKIKHDKLRAFTIESGGLPEPLLRAVWKADLPKLTHLELWLGTDSYGGIAEVAPLKPLLSGKLFPKLKHLGLRNSEITDAVARALAESPLLERLDTLDLSLGNLSDAGGEALLGCPAVHKLKKLDLHHHYLSEYFSDEFEKLPCEVEVEEPCEPEFEDYEGCTQVHRYNAVSE